MQVLVASPPDSRWPSRFHSKGKRFLVFRTLGRAEFEFPRLGEVQAQWGRAPAPHPSDVVLTGAPGDGGKSGTPLATHLRVRPQNKTYRHRLKRRIS